jgi:hypothetical protein
MGYLYWKHDKKLNKKYVGKNLEDFRLKVSQGNKTQAKPIKASKGNVLAKQYLEKLKKEEVSIDWAHGNCR